MFTGPRTPEGKARSSVNALKHGFTGRTMIVAADEQQDHAAFLTAWEADLLPQGAVEAELAAQIVQAAWNLRRLARAEAELIDESLGSPDPLSVDAAQAKLKLYSVYQQRAERSFHKGLAELRKQQEERLFRESQLPDDHGLPALPRSSVVRRDISRDDRLQDAASDRELEAIFNAPPPGRQTNSPASAPPRK